MKRFFQYSLLMAIFAIALFPSCKKEKEKEVTLVSIAVSGTPTKTVYLIGEPFNPAGLTVTATYSDNKTAAVPLADLVFATDFSATAGANKSVKVSFTYKGITRERQYQI